MASRKTFSSVQSKNRTAYRLAQAAHMVRGSASRHEGRDSRSGHQLLKRDSEASFVRGYN